MYKEQKKNAPEAATSETKNRKILSINSILKIKQDVKIIIKHPGEVPQIISAFDVLPEFLSKKLLCETFGTRFSLISDPKSCDRMNISFGGMIYRGTVLIVNRGFNKLFEMSDCDQNEAIAWLIKHSV